MVTGQQNKITCNREGSLPMSIGFSGLDTPCCVRPVTIDVSPVVDLPMAYNPTFVILSSLKPLLFNLGAIDG